jgi:MoaA/NifB/PqqE/SkfB family radical SAM enzyme
MTIPDSVWLPDNVSMVHCELSTFCNAACPSCPRFFTGTHVVRSGVTLSQVSIDQFKNWFDLEFIKNVDQWKFCGTHGDPLMAKDVVKIIHYIFDVNPQTNININTNGGLRSEQDWKVLGEISFKHKLTIIFSIDGLEDTNHLYRRNVDWTKLMLNVQSYIDSGGCAHWEFLTFRHNEHQLEEAKALSKKLGFVTFQQKRAVGFEQDGKLTDMPVFKANGEYDYSILPPLNPDYRMSKISLEKIIDKRRDNLTNFYKENIDKLTDDFEENVSNFKDTIDSDNVTINCNSKKDKNSEIYINVNGIVFPCCFMGNSIDAFDSQPHALQLKTRLREYGVDNFDLNKKSITKILNENHLNLFASNDWETPKCLEFCKKTCGNSTIINRIYDIAKRTITL